MHRPRHLPAILLAIAIGAAPMLGCRVVCVDSGCIDNGCADDERIENGCETGRLGQRRPLAGRLAQWKASCAEHFAEEPVVAPQSRFHPVPTRPVFSPPTADELAALFTPPAPIETPPHASAPSTKLPGTTLPATTTPEAPPVESPVESREESPIRTAGRGDRVVPTSAPKSPPTTPQSDNVSEPNGQCNEKQDAALVHSTFGPMQSDAPLPGGESCAASPGAASSIADDPLLWRAVRTPAGSLRAVPAESIATP